MPRNLPTRCVFSLRLVHNTKMKQPYRLCAKQPLAIVADAELDRDAVIAVKMVGQGGFGEVYLVGGADLGF